MGPEIISERFPHVVSAVFDNEQRARDAAAALAAKGSLSNEQIDVVEPNDPGLSHKVEPESEAIFQTILRSHAILGVVGVVAGLILAGILIGAGFAFATSFPGWLLGIFAVIGGAIGMLVAGLVSARPDHQYVVTETRDAAKHGKWTVVAHARDMEEKNRVDELLKQYSEEVTESL
ncbi:MAG TPA: hypothetical protein VK979_05850 [Guyparkeria sp.]|nr:hypothetical protein [Guyparkeria sp.]